ncbi:MAG: protein jag [Streptococcaceae bacterium]|jgi:spoIIIJ-associated protein|nr:protein jag [Streptococcaceae bacterium]
MASYTGNTVEEAIERGLKREGIARENAHIEIEQRESSGVLGFGRKRARVSIEPIHAETIRRADRMATRNVDQSDLEVEHAESAMEATLRLNKVIKAVRQAGIQTDENLTEEEREEKIAEIEAATKTMSAEKIDVEAVSKIVEEKKALALSLEELAEKIIDYLNVIVDGMDIQVNISYKKTHEGLEFNMSSNHDALLIGKHGKILESLEVLAKALASVSTSERVNVRVNVGDYHEKRERYLVSLAKRAADRVLSTGEPVYISDLPAHERKIIHNTLSNYKEIDSHSEGQGTKRFIVVQLLTKD